ncbi:MAG TPA: glycosyltransferase family 9 protein [Gammaproteobacteria bacterium]|nr:glycosyltransferase family 9 protein [Gammaproteobacteria bacterium]
MARLPLPAEPRHVCLLRLSAIGDVTHVLPIVHSLRRGWPDTRLTWIVGATEAKLVGDLPDVEFIEFDKSGGLAAWRDLRRRVTGRRFDLLLHMQVAMRANLVSTAVRAGIRLGYDRSRSRDLHGLFINHRIPERSGQHVVDCFFSFLETAGLNERIEDWSLPIPDEAREFAREQLPGDRRTLLISPCASHPLRNWRPEHYAAVADHAASEHDFRIVLVGGPSRLERATGDAIAARMRTPPLDLIGRDTLKRLLALLERADVLLSPDSGPAHMATCVDTPVLGLYAASNVWRSGPYRSRRWCIDRYDQAARRFLGHPAAELPWGTKIERPGVMDLISPDAVIERLDALVCERLEDGAQASP